MEATMAKYTQPYDQRYVQREVSRAFGLDPGTGMGLEDSSCLDPDGHKIIDSDTLDNPGTVNLNGAPRGLKKSTGASPGK
jgi:hypothetical protein